jgi:hypothetical protein
MSIKGISGKSVACLLLYRMGRVDFAVDRDHDLHRISAAFTYDGGHFVIGGRQRAARDDSARLAQGYRHLRN